MPRNAPKIALLIETSRGYGRGILRGVTKYSRLYGPWHFHLTPGDFEQILPRMSEWGGDGIIARVMDERTAKLILRMGVPAILLDVPEEMRGKKLPSAGYVEMASDSAGAARMVAEALLEKQFRHFAYVGYHGQVWSEIRRRAFVERVREAGFSVAEYAMPVRGGKLPRWEKEEEYLSRWLAELPRPVGVMACNDQRGREVLEACELAGITVPEEMAVIGVDNDELLCEVSYPPLSSVALNAVQGGFQAARMLDEMMRGRRPGVERIVVEPLRVVERRSSEAVAIDDPDIAQALQYIHTQPVDTLAIQDVVEHLAVSRRALELRFKKFLGRTILQEIQKVRLARAKHLLQETDLPIPRISEVVGFATASYFIQVFRAEMNMTPAKYRLSVREG